MSDPNISSLDNIEERYDEDAVDLSCTTDHDLRSNNNNNKLVSSETKAVTCLRIGLAAVLLTATIVSALGIYFLTSGLEQDEFEDAFADNSAKLLEAFQSVADRRLGAIQAFAASVTAHAVSTNATWPFVSIPQFAAQGEHVLNLAGALSLVLVMVVEPEERSEWENSFIPKVAPKWVAEESLFTNQTSESSTSSGGPPAVEEEYEGKPDVTQDGFYKQIYDPERTSSGGYRYYIAKNETSLVWWQNIPFSVEYARKWINMNVRDDESFEGEVLDVLKRKRVGLGMTTTNSHGSQGMPITTLYYPLLTGFSNDARVGGAFGTLMNWDLFFVGVLPQNANGLVAVLKNTCGQAFTFMINGPEVVYLGEGDLHDSNYNDMMREVSFTSLINDGIEKGTFKGLPLDENGCQYSLQVHASGEMEDQYISNMPIVYTCGAVLIFVFTSLVFILYDRLVEHRQRIVEREAQKSGAIVSSLFPAAYKEKLLEEQEMQLEKKTGSKMHLSEAKIKKLSNMMAGKDSDLMLIEDQIADLHPDCTVLFADISVSCCHNCMTCSKDKHGLLLTVPPRTGFYPMELQANS